MTPESALDQCKTFFKSFTPYPGDEDFGSADQVNIRENKDTNPWTYEIDGTEMSRVYTRTVEPFGEYMGIIDESNL